MKAGKLGRVGLSVAIVVCCSVACSTTTSGLKTRFARERGCPPGEVQVSEAGGSVYRANGCGEHTEYICESFAGFGASSTQHCRERGLNPHEPSGMPPPVNTSRPELEGPK